MSRSDLDAIQTKLKTAIQSHQMLVMKIKNEPQNAAMKDKLHELQAEIRNLSNEQKALVEELRAELMQNAKVSAAATAATVAATTGVLAQPTMATIGQPRLVAIPPQGAILPMSVVVPLAHMQRPTLVAFPGILNQPADMTSNKDQQQQQQQQPPQFVMNIQCTTATPIPITATPITTTINNNIAPKPAVSTVKPAQPATQERPIQPRRTSPPIKVPQYPVNQARNNTQQGQTKPASTANNNGLIHRSLSESDSKTLKKSVETGVKDARRVIDTRNMSPIEKRKMEFMASLDLVTPGALKEMQSRRVERKRRSTANPQFSYTFELDRKRNTGSSWLDGMQSSNKRPRGRPSRSSPSPNSSQPGSPGSPDDIKSTKNGALEDDSHENVCAECSKGGELLMCATCPFVYHLDCLSPPLATVPPSPWSCPACIVKGKGVTSLSNGALSMVHSYITSKTSKEEEKRRLQRKNTELQNEKTSLQEKSQNLKQQIEEEKTKGEQLEESISQKTQQTAALTNFIKSFQAPVASQPVPVPETSA